MKKKKSDTATTDKNVTDFMDKLTKKKAEMKEALLTGNNAPPQVKADHKKGS